VKLALALLLLACVATRPAPLSNRGGTASYMAPERRARGEFACSSFHYYPVVFGGCWWVR